MASSTEEILKISIPFKIKLSGGKFVEAEAFEGEEAEQRVHASLCLSLSLTIRPK